VRWTTVSTNGCVCMDDSLARGSVDGPALIGTLRLRACVRGTGRSLSRYLGAKSLSVCAGDCCFRAGELFRLAVVWLPLGPTDQCPVADPAYPRETARFGQLQPCRWWCWTIKSRSSASVGLGGFCNRAYFVKHHFHVVLPRGSGFCPRSALGRLMIGLEGRVSHAARRASG
jgi:hypothetical protein